MPKLQVTVGLPASGKSSYAMGVVRKSDDTVAFSYDDFRKMLKGSVYNGHKTEELVRKLCFEAVSESLKSGFNVIVHNTTLTQRAQDMWRQFAKAGNHHLASKGYKFELKDFTNVPVDVCIARDNLRQGQERVSPPVIWNMALHAGLMKFDSRPIVLVDVDGTLADHEGIRSPYDEEKVHMDKPVETVVQWVKNLVHFESCECGHPKWVHIVRDACGTYEPQNFKRLEQLKKCPCLEYKSLPDYQVIILSGRSTLCALSTYNWIVGHGIPHSAIFMRGRGDKRPDTVVKKEMLDAILKYVPKSQISFVIDDRPSVVRMWRENGLRVFPARGQCEEF